MEKERSNVEVVVNSSCNIDNNVTFNSKELSKAIEKETRAVGISNIIAGQDVSNSMIASSNMVSSSIDKIAKSNDSIGKSIKQGALAIFNGLGKISDEMERNNKVKEYRMLQKEIEEYEDWLIDHGLLKQFYDTVQIEKIEELQISQEDIAFITTIFCGEDASSAIQLMAREKSSLIEYYLRNLIGKKIYLKNKQMIVDDRVLIRNYESFGKVRGSAKRGILEFVIEDTAIEIKSNVDCYFIPSAPPYLIDYSTTSIERYCDKLYEFMVKHREDSLEAMNKVNNFQFYMVPSKKQLMLLLKKMNCPDINKLADLQRTISLIEVENALNNLRNLHEQLRLTVRNYKIQVAIA